MAGKLPQNSAPEANAVEADVMSDWIKRLREARQALKLAQEIEKEAKEKIASFLAERGAEYGTVNGNVVVRCEEKSQRRAPTLAALVKIEGHIANKYGNEIAAFVQEKHAEYGTKSTYVTTTLIDAS
jgi:propanediol dehydratase small subunit